MDEVKGNRVRGQRGRSLRSADYDAVAEGSANVDSLLARGIDPNATVRCERWGSRPSPLWRAVAACGGAAGMDTLRAAGCRFEAPKACKDFVGSICLGLNPSLARWYLGGAAKGLLPVPASDHERQSAWMALGAMACRISAQEDGGAAVFSSDLRFPWEDGVALEDGAAAGLGTNAWGGWARQLASIAGAPTAGMLVNSAKMGMGSAIAELLGGAAPSAASAIEAGRQIEAAATKGASSDWLLARRRGNPRPSRLEWSESMEAGRVLGRAGVAIDLSIAARSGNAYVLALALGSGAKPVSGREELALFVAAIAESSQSTEEFLSIALGPILGHASKSGVARCAVEELARAGCSYTAAPKKRAGARCEPGAEVAARRYLKKNPSDDPMGYLAIMGGGPLGLAATLGLELPLIDDQGLPSSMAEFAKFIGRMAERERLGKALAPKPGLAVLPRRL